MTVGGLAEKVQALLHEHLRSFEGLEVLILLHAQPSCSWTAATISARLHLDPDLIREALSRLASSGLVRQVRAEPADYQYHAKTPDLAVAVDELVSAYREQRASVMSQMSANAIERIRFGSLKAFADAFVLSERKDDD